MNKIKKYTEFELAAIKLSVFYVLIAMAISISFSVALFNISKNEVGRGIGRNFRVIHQCSLDRLPVGFENLERAQNDQIREINNHFRDQLIYFNLIILIISSALSYFLAKKTLHPLELAMESQNRFTADASHELRTPLSAMRAEIEVALRDENLTKDEARKLLSSNIEEVEKLENLSDALLKLARYGKGAYDFRVVNVSDLVAEAFEKVEKLAKAKKIEFVNDLQKAQIVGDRQSLIELFFVLLENAVKYSEKGKRIEISVSQYSDKVFVKIKDQGIGIKSSEIPYIFERFYRADSSRSKDKINGYGLGLSLAKQIASVHGAKISVKSSPNRGSEFDVVFSRSNGSI